MSSDCKKTVVVGKRQVLRELKKANLSKIILASDAEKNYISSIYEAAEKFQVEIMLSDTMESLGKKYGIDVGCAAIGVLKS